MRSAVLRWMLALSISLLLAGLLLSEAARAQEAAGVWHGTLALPGKLAEQPPRT